MNEHSPCTNEAGVQRARTRGAEVATVIDIGASNGQWSRAVFPFFPRARFHLIEAKALHEPGLKEWCATHPGASYVLAAAGPSPGTADFFPSESPWGGAVAHGWTNPTTIKVPMTSVDAEIARLSLPAPYFIKLDTHGFELPILEGAAGALKQASLVQIEAYNIPWNPKVLHFADTIKHMESIGFRCADLVEPLNRPRDGLLWQVDLLFEPAARACFAQPGW